jgi:hypothetical protein
MNNVEKIMEFDVLKDLKDKESTYNVKIELENEVSSYTRECAKALASAILRNNEKRIYGEMLGFKEITSVISEQLTHYLESENFKIKSIDVTLINAKKR